MEAIRLAATMDKSSINKQLLDQRNEFVNSPAYLSVTQRLYQKHPAVRREEEMMCLSGSTYPASSQMQKEFPAI